MKKYFFIVCLIFAFIYAKDSKLLGYSIQVGSFKDIKNAGNLADYLNKLGLDAFFFKENGMYKVRFGNFTNMTNAKERALKLQSKKLIDSFFVVSPQSYGINQKDKNNLRDNLSKHAHSYIGVPYKWGGESSSGFDCSGLVRSVYKLNGINLPRTSIEQFKVGDFVLKKDLKIGDLVFFTNNGGGVNHVGIYIGKNKFIHAPGKGKSVRIADLESSYWKKAYKGAKRYFH